MSDITSHITPDKNYKVDGPIDKKWTRQTITKKEDGSILNAHYVPLKNKASGRTYLWSRGFNPKALDEKTQVIYGKSMRNLFKNISEKDAIYLESKLKNKQPPTFFQVFDKDKKLLGVVPIFPGDKSTDGKAFCWTRDGKSRMVWKETTGESFHAKLAAEFTSKNVGYEINAPHSGASRKAKGLGDDPSQTRNARADNVLSQLKKKDKGSVDLTNVTDKTSTSTKKKKNPEDSPELHRRNDDNRNNELPLMNSKVNSNSANTIGKVTNIVDENISQK